jgi:hypothetical protein
MHAHAQPGQPLSLTNEQDVRARADTLDDSSVSHIPSISLVHLRACAHTHTHTHTQTQADSLWWAVPSASCSTQSSDCSPLH